MYQLQLRVGVSHTRQRSDRQAFEFQGEIDELPNGITPAVGEDLELPGLLGHYELVFRVDDITVNRDVTEVRGFRWCNTDGDFCYHEDSLRDMYGTTRRREISTDEVIPAKVQEQLNREADSPPPYPSDGVPCPGVVSPQGASDAPYCMQCGVQMTRAGSGHACPSCGSTSGFG